MATLEEEFRCPHLHRCTKSFELVRRIDSLVEAGLKKDSRIAQLEKRVKDLEALISGGTDCTAAKPFGISTPSSKLTFKPGSTEEAQRRKGGRPKGHAGSGRKSISESEADKIEEVFYDGCHCPHCHGELEELDVSTRSVIEAEPVRFYKKLIKQHRKFCPHCHKAFTPKAPGVLPRVGFGNQLGAQLIFDHYFSGITAGTLARRLKRLRRSIWAVEHLSI